MVKRVYLSGRLNDYVGLVTFPNLHIVTATGNNAEHEHTAPIFSPLMHLFLGREYTGELAEEIDRLYAGFIDSVKYMPAADAEYMRRKLLEEPLIPKRPLIMQALGRL